MKSVLIIVPFENIYPPVNGGMLRSINLLDQLAKHFELTAVIRQSKASFLKAVKEFPALGNCTVVSSHDWSYKPDLFSFLPQKIATAVRYRYWNRSLSGPAEANFLQMYPILTDLLHRKKFDFIILEDLAILNIAKIIRRFQPHVPIVYDAYNVNTRLAEASFQQGHTNKKTVELTRQAENNLTNVVDAIFTCSHDDLVQLGEMNQGKLTGVVIPNGVTINPLPTAMAVNEPTANNVFFCGSLNYHPNFEGLHWFYEKVWPIIRKDYPQAKLTVVGSGSPAAQLANLQNDDSVMFAGMVPDVNPYYEQAAVSIVPLLSGSGTRLKILEAMSKGVPIVSTSVGAEGINYEEGKDILIANDINEFAQKVISLLKNKEKRIQIQQNARELVIKHYDWNKIGKDLVFELNNTLTLGKSKKATI
jgi:glycosyltransferase involved in cell wall biosynthesis